MHSQIKVSIVDCDFYHFGLYSESQKYKDRRFFENIAQIMKSEPQSRKKYKHTKSLYKFYKYKEIQC